MKKSTSVSFTKRKKSNISNRKVKSQNTISNNGTELTKEISTSATISKKSFEEIKPPRKINYEEELILYLYNFLLDIIIEDYSIVKPNEITNTVEENEDEKSKYQESIVKDYYDINMNELKESDILFVNGAKVSLSKHSGIVKPKSNSREICVQSELYNENETEFQDISVDENKWMLDCETENVIIKYKNGNVYEGTTYRKLFHGDGVFKWKDGVTYEGQFFNGDATGKGLLILSDLTYYRGDLCQGLLHGFGSLYVGSTPWLYNGGWKSGRKHGKGWLLYGNNNWYDGEWFNDQYHGWGFRQYSHGVRYKGNWASGSRNGLGTMVYKNGDFYSGEWKIGLKDGYGEYTWRAFLNMTFTFALENIYQGMWSEGTRHGAGIMHFGIDGGVRLTGLWHKNLKNGPGIMICGNGVIVQGCPLFVADKPVHVDRYESMSILTELLHAENILDQFDRINSTNFSTFELISQRLFMNKTLNSISDLPKYKTMCNPIGVPIYAPPETLYVQRYIDRIIEKFESMKCFLFQYIKDEEERLKAYSTKKWNVYATHTTEYGLKLDELNEPIDEKREEKLLRRCFRKNACQLRNLYNYYASLCHNGPIDFDIILIRLFLWQLFRDVELTEKYSMVYIDKKLIENDDIGFELIHNPFEKIYYWQFLHCLLELSLLTFENFEKMIGVRSKGILATIFQTFLNKLLEKHEDNKDDIYNPFVYLHLLPIESVYLLYQSIGEPHTAKTFLKNSCIKKGTFLPLYLNCYDWKMKRESIEGINIVPLGENFTFYSKPTEFFSPVNAPLVPVDEFFYKHLYVFRSLGPRRIIQCLTTACPLITRDFLIVNMEYELTFLEFFETLMFCAYMMVDDARQEEIRLKELEKEMEKPEEIEVIEIPQKSKKKKNK